MTKKKLIHNIQELAAEVGAAHDTIESISRRIYKDTSCGAWVDERNVATVTRKVDFQVRLGDSILGIVAHSWRRGGRGEWHSFDESLHEAAPESILLYLGGPYPKLVGPHKDMLKLDHPARTVAELRQYVLDDEALRWGRPYSRNNIWLTVDVITRKPGIGVGSIVEGSDAEVGPYEMAFPFYPDKFWTTVQEVNSEACALWGEANSDNEGETK